MISNIEKLPIVKFEIGEELSDKIERLKGTLHSETRDAFLGNIRSLDEVLKEYARSSSIEKVEDKDVEEIKEET